jgi:predicted AAA+ superfamily ATPase
MSKQEMKDLFQTWKEKYSKHVIIIDEVHNLQEHLNCYKDLKIFLRQLNMIKIPFSALMIQQGNLSFKPISFYEA